MPEARCEEIYHREAQGRHHFDGDYANLARQILAAADSVQPIKR